MNFLQREEISSARPFSMDRVSLCGNAWVTMIKQLSDLRDYLVSLNLKKLRYFALNMHRSITQLQVYLTLFIEGMRDARKLFRLFKSLVEYQKICQLQKQKLPHHKKLLNILTRLGFLFYWFFDNLQILSKIRFIDGVDSAQAAKKAAFFWFLALVFSIATVLVQAYETA